MKWSRAQASVSGVRPVPSKPIMLLVCLADAPEHRRDACRRQAQCRAKSQRVRGSIQCLRITRDFDRKALLMTGIVAAITGASIRGIVGRRANVQKLEA